MKQRKLIIGLLVTLAVAVSGFTFAYWASGVDGTAQSVTGSVTIGESTDTYSTTVDLTAVLDGAGETLVPDGKASVSASGAVEEVVLTYEVEWIESVQNSVGFTGNVSAAGVATLTGTDDEDYSGLVSVAVSYTEGTAIIVNGDAVLVTFTVTLTEPGTQAIYKAIINQSISIEFTFTITED